jgi:hypothetical protein
MWPATYIAATLVIGLGALSLVGKRARPPVELFGFAATLGMGATGTLLIWLSMVGLRPSRWSVMALAVMSVAILCVRRVRVQRACEAMQWMLLLPAGLLVYLIIVVAAASWALPLWETDAFVIWGLKAKVLAGEALRPRPEYFTDRTLSFSHLDYPLLLPMLDAAGFSRLLSPLTYVALGAVVYSAVRAAPLARVPAAMIVALLLGAPAVVRWAGAGVADPLVALFAAAAVASTIRRDDLPIAAACCAFLVMTKLEGMVLAALLCVAMLALHRSRFGIACVTGAILTALPWIAWSLDLPRTHEDYGSRISPANVLRNLDKLPTVLAALGRQILDLRAWGMLWPLLALAAAIGFRAFRDMRVIAVWFILIGQMLAFIVAYLVTPWNLAELIPMTQHRLLLQIAPLTAILLGVQWAELSKRRTP